MSLEFELDLGGTQESDAELGPVKPGFYAAVVEDVKPDEKVNEVLIFTYKLTQAPYAGRHVTDRLWHPSLADDADKAKRMTNRYAMYAKRLGLITGSDFGKTVKLDWLDAISKPVVLKIEIRKYKDKETGDDRETSGVAYSGVYNPDHPDLPAGVRQAGTPRPADQSGAAAQQQPPKPKPTFDYSKL